MGYNIETNVKEIVKLLEHNNTYVDRNGDVQEEEVILQVQHSHL